jgi:hypothetical protein
MKGLQVPIRVAKTTHPAVLVEKRRRRNVPHAEGLPPPSRVKKTTALTPTEIAIL